MVFSFDDHIIYGGKVQNAVDYMFHYTIRAGIAPLSNNSRFTSAVSDTLSTTKVLRVVDKVLQLLRSS